jgi:hypothetical protein
MKNLILSMSLLMTALPAWAGTTKDVDTIRALIAGDLESLKDPKCLKKQIKESEQNLALISTGCAVDNVNLEKVHDEIQFIFQYACPESEKTHEFPIILWVCKAK